MITMKFRKKGRIETIMVANEDCPEYLFPPEGKDAAVLTGFSVIFLSAKNDEIARLKMANLPSHIAKIGCAGGRTMFREVYFFDFPEDVKGKIKFEKSENYAEYEKQKNWEKAKQKRFEETASFKKETEVFNKKNAPWSIEWVAGGCSYPPSLSISYREALVRIVDFVEGGDVFDKAEEVMAEWKLFLPQIEEILSGLGLKDKLMNITNKEELPGWQLQGKEHLPSRYVVVNLYQTGRKVFPLE